MNKEDIKISRIIEQTSTKPKGNYYSVIWVKNNVEGIKIDDILYKNISNSIFFLDPKYHWEILTNTETTSNGHILFLSNKILNEPILNKLHINEVALLNSNTIPRINLSPGIEVGIQAILEMIDELIGSHLNHKHQAILSLLNTFFIYCDGQCNIKSLINDNSSKPVIVYKFKKLINAKISEFHDVAYYSDLLNVSSKYLNECVQETLNVNAKSLITEQLIMKSRSNLKFTNKTIKQISFDLGFSSPDYFSYFFKNQTGTTPSLFRKN